MCRAVHTEATSRQEAADVSRRVLVAFCGVAAAAVGCARVASAAEESAQPGEAVETSSSGRTPDTTITHKVLFSEAVGSKEGLHAQGEGGSGRNGEGIAYPSCRRNG